MKATELRIGNLIRSMYSLNKEPYEVYPHFFGQCFLVDDQPYDLDKELTNVEPIPLTEEWLEKFGFSTYEVMLFSGTATGYILTTEHFDFKVINLYVSLDGRVIDHIKHVHQLQNLYFAITGEELKQK